MDLRYRIVAFVLLPAAAYPLADAAIKKICGYTHAPTDARKDNICSILSFTTFPPKAWGVGNIKIIAHFVIFCQAKIILITN